MTMLNPQTLIGQGNFKQGDMPIGNVDYQDEPYGVRKFIAVTKAEELQRGTLIVRLLNYDEKYDYLIKKGNRDKAKELKEERLEKNSFFMEEIKKDYDFSDVVFCYGSQLESYLLDRSKKIFLNDQLEVDSSIKIKAGPIFILGTQANGVYYLFDENLNSIPRPAPYAKNIEEVPFPKILVFMDLFKRGKEGKIATYSIASFNYKLNRLVLK